jgi:hypothetical protein
MDKVANIKWMNRDVVLSREPWMRMNVKRTKGDRAVYSKILGYGSLCLLTTAT